MTTASRETIIPKTEASSAKLDAIVKLVARFMQTEQQARDLARVITEFAEQAILDDRARREQS